MLIQLHEITQYNAAGPAARLRPNPSGPKGVIQRALEELRIEKAASNIHCVLYSVCRVEMPCLTGAVTAASSLLLTAPRVSQR
jgi:hypothetical protein